jgi:3-hydroxyisobutyrate dehydrogenase
MKLGVIGTGMMGAQLAIRLAKSGHKVMVFNRDRLKAQIVQHSVAENEIRIASTPAEVGKNSEFVIVCVKNYQAILDITTAKGDTGLLDSPKSNRTRKDFIVIQCSTISPTESNHVANLYGKKNINVITMPILGGVSAAERGDLILIAAGPKKSFNQTKSLLKDLSKQVFYVGLSHATASTLKLAVNINIALIALALAEGLTFVKGSGIDPDIFIRIFNSTYFKTGISENKGPKIIRDEYTTSFSVANMAKDLELTLKTAYSSGLTLPATASTHGIYKASEAVGLSGLDYTSIASFISRLNGISRFGKRKRQTRGTDFSVWSQ